MVDIHGGEDSLTGAGYWKTALICGAEPLLKQLSDVLIDTISVVLLVAFFIR